MIHDSRVGFLDLKVFSREDELESTELNKIIDDSKPLVNSATDRNTINKDNYVFYFNKLLTSRGKIQNDVLTNDKLIADMFKYGGV